MIDDVELMTLRQQEEREAAGDAVQSVPRAEADDFLDARPVQDVSTVSGTQDAGTLAWLHGPFSDNVAGVVHAWSCGSWGVSRYQTTSAVPPS